MALTADQLIDFRADIGDPGTMFTDAALERLYTDRASEDYSQAVVLALRQILSNTAKLTDYQLAHSMEKRSQAFEHVKYLLSYWEGKVTNASGQVAIVGMRSVPPRTKDEPSV